MYAPPYWGAAPAWPHAYAYTPAAAAAPTPWLAPALPTALPAAMPTPVLAHPHPHPLPHPAPLPQLFASPLAIPSTPLPIYPTASILSASPAVATTIVSAAAAPITAPTASATPTKATAGSTKSTPKPASKSSTDPKPTGDMSSTAASSEPRSFARRDRLVAIEADVQKQWKANKVFEATVPADTSKPKFFCTFPYPYMNGRLHLGHSFSLSKAEFAAGYERSKGKEVLFPFAFHCTGMPIKACADKLKREMEDYGCPPDFSRPPAHKVEGARADDGGEVAIPKDPSKGKKTKLALKSGGEVRQWNIMRSLGIADDEIPKFADAAYWLSYFPPLAKDDLDCFGLHVDWRRSFITTDVNPYYDSFIKWQFTKLRQQDRIKFGKRNTVYSPLDGQPCADHDRATGEGVGVQEYTGIKMRVVDPLTGKLAPLEGRKVFLVAATLRPETMYGQTNCFVLPDGDYGAYEMADDEIFIISEHSARNFAYQFKTKEFGEYNALLTVKGSDLFGLALKAPLTSYDKIHVLPLLTISMYKGTGVVTSVPSDAPDDYAALQDWKKKPQFREKYGIKDEWVLPFEVIPIIEVPEYGTTAAVKACEEFKVQSQNDKDALAKAKERVYLKGFYEGVMIIGDEKGKKVRDAKPIIKQMLLDTKQAVTYCEPEKQVISRSGDECVVCLTDQWYLDYGEEVWQGKVKGLLADMDTFTYETKHQLGLALDWLNQWACSRNYGLGTTLPWDENVLIDSLSDSTVYMAFYTIAHILQGGVVDGSQPGPYGIKPEQLTEAVWDHIFLDGPKPADTKIPAKALDEMRAEFNYWYPLNLRVSGKDLIQNHLIFWLYNHVAVFGDDPTKWPRGVRANGHLMLNNDKMSKSTGNFLTLRGSCEKYSTDVTRLGLADAGDGMEDANFVEDNCNAAILRITKLLDWTDEVLADSAKQRTGELTHFADRAFDAEINKLIIETDKAYAGMMYRDALKLAHFDLIASRDHYRNVVSGIGLHRDLAIKFLTVHAVMMAPITPHISEYIWAKVGNKGSVLDAPFPTADTVDESLLAGSEYLRDVIHDGRVTLEKLMTPKKAKKGEASSSSTIEKPNHGVIRVATQYPRWQQIVLSTMKEHYNAKTGEFADGKVMAAALKQKDELKPFFKKAMPFVQMVKVLVDKRGPSALDLTLPFDEAAILEGNKDFLTSIFEVDTLEIAVGQPLENKKGGSHAPGQPCYEFTRV